MQKIKSLEYYFDSKEYTQEEVQENIEEIKREFPNKKIKVETEINNYGVYVLTVHFENKNSLFNKFRIFIKSKKKNTLLLEQGKEITKSRKNKRPSKKLEKYYGKEYGLYKQTKQYRPY